MPVDDVTVSEVETEVEKVEQGPTVAQANGRDIKAERRLELIAEEAAVDLE